MLSLYPSVIAIWKVPFLNTVHSQKECSVFQLGTATVPNGNGWYSQLSQMGISAIWCFSSEGVLINGKFQMETFLTGTQSIPPNGTPPCSQWEQAVFPIENSERSQFLKMLRTFSPSRLLLWVTLSLGFKSTTNGGREISAKRLLFYGQSYKLTK